MDWLRSDVLRQVFEWAFWAWLAVCVVILLMDGKWGIVLAAFAFAAGVVLFLRYLRSRP
jgi:hypothetical protein